ncbi:hypothetical protein E4U55_002010, partial [Claviceps digitariae]
NNPHRHPHQEPTHDPLPAGTTRPQLQHPIREFEIRLIAVTLRAGPPRGQRGKQVRGCATAVGDDGGAHDM